MTRAATRVGHNGQEATSEPSRAPRKRQSLIGNDVHSPASASHLSTVTSIFLISNEFHLSRASEKNPHAHKTSMGTRKTGRVNPARTESESSQDFTNRSFALPTTNVRKSDDAYRDARKHTSLLRHAHRSNSLTPFRTSVPIVTGMAPPARKAGACLRYRRCPQFWLRTTTATFRRWCRSSSKRKAFVWSR